MEQGEILTFLKNAFLLNGVKFIFPTLSSNLTGEKMYTRNTKETGWNSTRKKKEGKYMQEESNGKIKNIGFSLNNQENSRLHFATLLQ